MPSRPTTTQQPPQGQTVPQQGSTQERVPRAPHERDESADSQEQAEPSGRAIGKMAHDDLARGRQDTDKGPVMDRVYEAVQAGEPPADGVKPAAGPASRR